MAGDRRNVSDVNPILGETNAPGSGVRCIRIAANAEITFDDARVDVARK
jgi:hypothetical protein